VTESYKRPTIKNVRTTAPLTISHETVDNYPPLAAPKQKAMKKGKGRVGKERRGIVSSLSSKGGGAKPPRSTPPGKIRWERIEEAIQMEAIRSCVQQMKRKGVRMGDQPVPIAEGAGSCDDQPHVAKVERREGPPFF